MKKKKKNYIFILNNKKMINSRKILRINNKYLLNKREKIIIRFRDVINIII